MTPEREAAIRQRDANLPEHFGDHWLAQHDRRLLLAEVDRLRSALGSIRECPKPESVEDCHDAMYEIACEALDG